MGNWATETIEQIENKLEGEKEKEIRFFRVDELKRNIQRVHDFGTNCPTCQQEKIPIKELADTIDEAIKVPGKSRREYDRLIDRLSKHIRKEHGFYPPYYFAYYYSFIGIALGLILGFALYKLMPDLWMEMISAGFVAGLLPGYMWGFVKDKKIRTQKRLM